MFYATYEKQSVPLNFTYSFQRNFERHKHPEFSGKRNHGVPGSNVESYRQKNFISDELMKCL